MTATTARPASIAVLRFLGTLAGTHVEFDAAAGTLTGTVEAVTRQGECRVRVTPRLTHVVPVDRLRPATPEDLPAGTECGECGVLHWGHECDTCWPDPLDNR